MRDLLFQPDPAGWLCKEKYLNKHLPELHSEIITYCSSPELSGLTFVRKVYHYKYDLRSIPVCKNPGCGCTVNFINMTRGYYEYCSTSCISKDPSVKAEKERLSYEKYGTKAPGMSVEVKQKALKTCIERYGGNGPMCNKEVQKKSRDTLFENYGVDNPAHSPEIIERRVTSFMENVDQWRENFERTMVERYGVPNAQQNPEILENTRKTNIEIYGFPNPNQNEEVLKKGRKTRKERYGFEYPLQVAEFMEKSRHSMEERYGSYAVMYSSLSGHTIDRMRESHKEIAMERYQEHNIVSVDSTGGTYTLLCPEGHVYTIPKGLFTYRLRSNFRPCTVCNPRYSRSELENQVYEFVDSIYSGRIIRNGRKAIAPLELDIHLPDLNLAIEVNGMYWHSEERVGPGYHENKERVCESVGIRLITVWEDEWGDRRIDCEGRIREVVLGDI